MLDAETAAFFASLGGRSVHFGADGGLDDVDGIYRTWLADAEVAVVLQRPDFYVYGTAASGDGTRSLVAGLRGILAA
jgi:hypothetical protein